MLVKGFITKVTGDNAYVEFECNVYETKFSKMLSYKKIKPTTGDCVEFEITDSAYLKGVIYKILDRKNELYRPRIANITQVAIICALKEPEFGSFILNKYLSFLEIQNIRPLIVFTKNDLLTNNDQNIIEHTMWYKKLGYTVFCISNKQKEPVEWEKFELALDNEITVFTGQTGAGKSTTLNELIPKLNQQTQAISKALNRGKHTTTINELFKFLNGYVADTPGFGSFDLKNVTAEELAHSYNFFAKNFKDCKFSNCLHFNVKIEVCAIIQAVNQHKFPEFIYNDYVKLQKQLVRTTKR